MKKQTSRKAHQKIHFIIFGFAEKLLSLFCTAWTREIYNVSIQLHIHTKKLNYQSKTKNILLLHTSYPRKLCLQWPWSCHQTSPYELPMSKYKIRISNFSNIEMFINRNPFLSWHVYSSIDHYIKLHHYHIKN